MSKLQSVRRIGRISAIAASIALGFIAFPVAHGQTFNDDFNDGNDTGWERYDVLETFGLGATYTFPDGNSYDIEIAPNHVAPNLGIGRAGSIVIESLPPNPPDPTSKFDDFRLTVDVTGWNDGREYVFGPIARTTSPGLGTTNGYLLILNAVDHDFQLLRIEGEAPNSEELGTADIDMPADRDFRIVYSGLGAQLNAAVYDLADLSAPLGAFSVDAANYGPAPTPAPYTSGAVGLIVAQSGSVDDPPPPPGPPYAATFDNFRVVAPTAGEWNALGGGATSAAFNWVGNVPADGAGAHARFLGGAETDAEVSIDTSFYSLGQITFDNANRYKLSGMPLTLQNTGDAMINVVSGSHEIAADTTLTGNLHVTGAGTLTVSGALDLASNSVEVTGATLRLSNVGALTNNATSQLTVGPAGTIELAGTPTPLVIRELSIEGGATPTGTFDIGASSAVIDYSGTSPVAAIRAQLLAGRGGAGLGATWAEQGINSTAAADSNAENDESRSVGYAENSTLPLGAYSMFKGEPVDDTAVIMAYTRTGDANLDGLVNDDDVTIVSATYAPGVPNPHWQLGDFDYDGVIDDNDITLLGVFYDPNALPIPAPATSSVAAVPEPASAVLLAIAAIAIVVSVRRCRRFARSHVQRRNAASAALRPIRR